MARGPKPQKIRGVYWREDRKAWAAQYRANGKLVRKVWTKPRRSSAGRLTTTEKKALREEKVSAA